MSNCDHNIIHQLSNKLDSVWRIDTFIRDAKKQRHSECAKFWQKMKKADEQAANQLLKILGKKAKRIC